MKILSEYLQFIDESSKLRDRVEVCVIKDKKLVVGMTKRGLRLPGGGVERNETFEKTAEREVLEELGIKIKNPLLLSDTPLIVNWNEIKHIMRPSEKTKERMNEYSGSQTFLMYAHFDKIDKSLYKESSDKMTPVIVTVDNFIRKMGRPPMGYISNHKNKISLLKKLKSMESLI